MESSSLTQRITSLSPAKRALLEAKLKANGRASAAHSITRRAERASAPLSFAQQRLWFLHQLEPDNPSYNQPKAIRLGGPLDVTSLQKALDHLVARHEVLRTTFASGESNPVQVIAESRAVEMPLIDLRARTDTDRGAEAQRLLTETIRRPFDLSHDLMLRALLLRLADQEYIFLLVTHHIASDGSSTKILWREIANLYQAFSANQPASLEQLPIQYADYAIWQRHWLQGEVLDSQLAYWKKQLAGAPPLLELSTDRPRPPVQTFRGARQTIVLPKKLTESLKAVSRREGVTLFMTLLAAFQTLLYRCTSQDDIVVGSPIAGRTRTEVEGLIGFFVNTLVLRTDFTGNPSFRELLARVREVALGAYAHQDLPFEKLVEELHPERNRSNSPLFQVMFVLQNDPRETLKLTGLSVSPFDIHSGTAKFDLLLSMREENEELKGAVEYNADLFDASTIARMIAHFHNLLKGIVTDPSCRLSEFPLLTAAERHQLLVEWNDTKRDYPNDQLVHQLFEQQVEKSPDAVAVVFEDQQLTYRDLNSRANQLAHYLWKLGVGPETLIAICVERSVEMLVSVLGILKAGAAYVPLDPSYPKERLGFMMADAQAPVVLTQKQLLDALPETIPLEKSVPRSQNGGANSQFSISLCLDTNWHAIAQESSENPTGKATPDSPAYVLYTSGSTGIPKGVVMEHRALCNLVWWQVQSWRGPRSAKTLQFASLSFDVSFQEIFATWCSGGTLVLISEALRRDALALLDFLRDNSVERLFLPFVALQQLAEVAQDTGVIPTGLREIITAGEQLQMTPQLTSLLRELNDCTLSNQYGPTESHVVTAHTLADSTDHCRTLPPIGRPIANTEIYLLDAHQQPVPIGVPGELYIGGAGLARGYLNLPELTAEKFVANPFGSESSSRLYKTGDLARYLPDGNIEFIGRLDHQVKIRGHRIELGEIEAVLNQHLAVREAVVLVREKTENRDSRLEDSNGEGIDPISKIGNPQSDRHLVAYVVSKQETVPTTLELRNFLKQKLPDYMVPSAFVMLDTLPLTPSGKLDRKALPAPDGSTHRSVDLFIAPRNDIEVQLARIWESVLGIQPIGVKDNFFDLGGHSLLAVRLFTEIEKTTGRKLPVATLFRAPTVEQFAKIFRLESSAIHYSSLVPIQPGGSKPPLFLVHGADGGVFDFAHLARHMGPDQPLYGLQSPGYDGEQEPLTEIESIAAHYVDEIRKAAPHGPYLLAGLCLGGTVAFEMSQQLHAQGQSVALLTLVDAPLIPRLSLPRYWLLQCQRKYNHHVVERFNHHRRNLRQLGFREGLAYVSKKVDGAKRRLISRGSLNKTDSETKIRPAYRAKVDSANVKARRRYSPQQYPGRIILFLAHDSPLKSANDRRLGWRELALGGVEIDTIPGNHSNMIWDPYAQSFAQKLRARIDEALSNNHSQLAREYFANVQDVQSLTSTNAA